MGSATWLGKGQSPLGEPDHAQEPMNCGRGGAVRTVVHAGMNAEGVGWK